VVKAGRFGEYVTDGEYNATLRKDDTIESLTLERAAELLQERRDKGPAKKTAKKGAKKAPAKKTAAKKTTVKKAATKTTAKKAAAKKS
jgi:DNA topoisomerase I